ncbi:MAG: hypothetical protein PHC47_02460 [Clostridia bacterium]|nr:hypothetical protein [Clostridia bacterium]
MYIAKKRYCILAIIFLVIVAITASAFGQINSKYTAFCEGAPSVEGEWLDGFDENNFRNYDLAYKDYNTGRGGTTRETALIIKTPYDLAFISYLTRNNNRGSETLKFYELGNDIDLAGKNWLPMGTENLNERSFMGIIDGKGFAIKNLTILEASGSYQGLIAYARSNPSHPIIKQNEFRNLTFDNVYIQGSGAYYAAIVGHVYGGLKIDNVTVNGYIETMNTGSSYVAGFVSRLIPLDNTVEISNVVNNASINNTGSYAAGIVAHIELSTTVGGEQPYRDNQNITILNAVNNGTIYAQNYLAGIVAYANYVKLVDSYNSGSIEGNVVAASYCAGLVGRAYYGVDIENCYNEGIVEGINAAGLVGYVGDGNIRDDVSIKNSYNIGQLIATNYVGGLITSVNYSTTQSFKLIMENCYNAGELSSGSYMSGIITFLYGNATLDRVYNKSNLANDGSSYSAGLVAYHYYGNLEILNSYNSGDITAVLNSYVAGLVACMPYNTTTNIGNVSIRNSYNLGNIEGSNVGGLLGDIRGSFQIEESFNIGDIIGSSSYAGGLVSYAQLYIHPTFYVDSSLLRCYNTGSVMGASYNGGLIGYLTFNTSNDGADEENHRIREIEINECINAGEAYQGTNNAGGIISRINYATKANRTQIVELIKAFSINDEDEIVLTNEGEFDPSNNLNLFGSISHALDSGTSGYLIIIDKEEGEEGADISRILSKQELQTQATYESVGYDFSETGAWLMPDENGTGNNGAPYLKTFGITVTLNVDGTENIYRATYKESLNIIEYKAGKTFIGWSTSLNSQDENYEFYPIGTPVVLQNSDITLYANFETTKYYKLLIEPAGVGSLAYEYEATYEKDGFAGGFTIESIYNNHFELTVTGEGDFVGWQVWKQIDENAGKWVPLVGKSKTLSLLDYPIDQEFIDEYVTFVDPETEISGTYWIFGELKIRAAKKTTDIAVSASTNDASLGKIKIADRDVSYSGQITLQDGIEIILEGLPIDHYKTTEFKVTYSYKDGETFFPFVPYCPDLLATNNIAMLNLDFVNLSDFPQTATDIEINIEVVFEKIEYIVELIVQLKDGSKPGNLPEISEGPNNGPLLLNEKADIFFFAPSVENLEGNSRYRFVSWKMYNHITNQLEEFNYGMNGENQYIFENNNVIDENFLNKYIDGEKVILIAEYAIDYMVNISSGAGGSLDINVVKTDGSAPVSYSEIENMYFEKGTVINITAKPNTYYLFADFNGSECGVINESDEKNLNIVLNSLVDVTATFNEDIYEIVLKTIDINNEDALTGADIKLLINDIEADRAKLNDIISIENLVAPESYRFEKFIFKNGENEKIAAEQTVDTNFLETYRTINNQIILIAYYVKQYELNVIIPDEQQDMGSFIIKIYNSETGEYDELSNPAINNFDIGTKLQIEVSENTHFDFIPFKTLSSSEKDLLNPNIANITLKNDRTLLLEFADIIYDIDFTPEVKGGGEMDISAESFKVGDEVVIMFTPASGQVVKNWTINNVSIEELKNSDYAVVRDNSITLTITESWFEEYGNNLISMVETQLNGTILTAIILVSIIVPGLLALLIIFSVLNNRKRKVIKAELQSMELNRYKMDTSSFMKDLREGKDVGQVTDEDVKAEMKRRKKSKK